MNVSIDLQNPITLPVNGQSLEKSGDKFVVDSSDESHPFDWHNAYFELDFQITNNRVVYWCGIVCYRCKQKNCKGLATNIPGHWACCRWFK